MLSLPTLTRVFALSIAGIGILQFIFRQVLIGRPAALIDNTSITTTLAFIVGIVLVLCAIKLWMRSSATTLLFATAIFVFVFSGLSNLYIVISQGDYGGVLTSFGKSITLGSALILYAQIIAGDKLSRPFNLCRICLGLFLAISGVQHFLFVDFVKFLVPSWIPFNVFWTYVAGVALIGTGLSLLLNVRIKVIAQLGGWMVFAWFLVLHIPRAFSEPNTSELPAVFESLAVSAILFTLSRLAKEK